MRVLIVDDEPPARARLRRLLAAHPQVQVVGEAGDADEALAAVAALAPDLLLLDVQMPGASGLDLAASLPDPAPAVVFVTAFDAYALPAFEAAAIDYLLKPVDPARLARSIERWPTAPRPGVHPPPQRLLVPERGGLRVVDTAGLLRLEAADNYVELHTRAQGTPLMRRTLAALVADLGPAFVRIHRRHAVALAQVRALLPGERGDARVRLADGTELPVSRAWRDALEQALAAPPG
ncbi:MAG: LytTR family DNA-binding domain-containing protein [Rubrivivax sp.]